MSRDRVELTLPRVNSDAIAHMDKMSDDVEKRLEAVCDAFNIGRTAAYKLMRDKTRIRVRPSQFARYIVLGSQYGARAHISCLELKLIKPEAAVVDLSTNSVRREEMT